MNFPLKRWLNDSDKPVRAALLVRKLFVESLEDRTTPSITIPGVPDTTPAVTVAPSSQTAIAGGYDPQEIINPSNSNQVVTVSTTGTALQFNVSNNLGQSWSTQPMAVAALADPTVLAGVFSVIDAPSITMDTNNNIYVAYIQRNTNYNASGALVVNKFTINSNSGAITAVPNTQNVLYRWVGQDPVYNPVIGVNNLTSSFTDPTTNTVTTNSNVNRGVFVAWNTNATQSGFGAIITPSVIQMAISDDGGASFSTPQFLTNNGFFGGTSEVLPQLYFTQTSVQNAIIGGKLGIAWIQNGNHLTNNTYTLPNAGTPLTVQQTFQGTGNSLGAINGATTPTGGVLTVGTTTFDQTVNINATGFTTLADLSVTLSVFSQDLSKMSIQLVSNSGIVINLLTARQTLDSNGNLQTFNSSWGLPGGAVGGLGEQIFSLGSNQYAHNPTGVTFSDNGARAINDPANASPYIITVRPENDQGTGSLSALYGLNAAQLSGTWHLVIKNYGANDTSSPPITAPSLDQWDMKFVSRVRTTGFGVINDTGFRTSGTTATTANTGALTSASPIVGVQGWYSVAVDTSKGSFSPYQGRIYIAYTVGSGNDTDIFLIYSTDGGQSWSTPTQVNDDSSSDGFSTGLRAQFQPTVTVDPTTGTVIVMWYDARWDGSNARPATFMATSVDGGDTFSPNTYLNTTQSALNAIDRSVVNFTPIPNNLAALSNGFGNHQGLVAYGGKIVPVWTGNTNVSGQASLMTATVVTAAGPRILQGDSGPVSDTFVNENNPNISYNNTFALDGTRQLTAFYVKFDRYVDPTTFTAADVRLMYQATTGAAMVNISSQVLSVTALDAGQFGATEFLVNIVPQSAVGTYSYAVGPTISDRIRHDGLTGNLMDQNANAVSGQNTGVDSFANPTPTGGIPFVLPYDTNTLPLIIPGPRIISSTPGVTNNGTVSYIDVTFDRDMLASTFTSSQVVELLTPQGVTLTSGFTVTANPPGTSAGNLHRTFRVSFPTQSASGKYSLVLGAGITSASGYKMDSNMNAGVDILTGRVASPTLAGTFLNQINTGNLGISIPAASNASTPSVSTSVLNISSSYIITQLLATPIQLRLNIAFPDVRKLTAKLIAPDGTTIQLFTNVGQFGVTTFANFTNTVFSDFAPANNLIQNGSAPFTNGPFLPQQQLSVLNGHSAQGNWTLQITNSSTTLSGTLNFWGLSLPQAVLGSGLGETVADQTTVPFTIFTTSASQSTSSTAWTPIGTGTVVDNSSGQSAVGIVTVTAVDASDPSGNTVYAGGENGGLWKTTNFLTSDPSGPTWIPLTDNGLPNSLHISSIAIVPNNNNPAQQSIIYVGTGDSATGVAGVGMLRSTDGGQTFRLIDSTSNADAQTIILPIASPLRDHLFAANLTYVNQITVDPVRLANGEFIVYAALGGSTSTQGLWRSINSGRDWTRIQAGGNCTSIVLAPNRFDLNSSGVPVLRTADVGYAAFTGAGGGVYFSSQISVASSMTLLTGGNGKPLFSNSLSTITVGNSGVHPNETATRILLAAPNATANTDPLAASIYQGWLYAYMTGGAGQGLYMTKDYGANWTFIQINRLTNTNILTNDATQPQYLLGADARYNSLVIDPSNPNIVYLGGTNGIIRVDTTAVFDAHAQVRYANDLGGVGAQSQTASIGGVTALAPLGFQFSTDYFNRLRDPNNPFVTNATQIIRYVSSFVNSGIGAIVSEFNGFYNDTLIRNMVTSFDPLTRKTRLTVATERGVYTAVDGMDPNPTQGLYSNAVVDQGIGSASSVNGVRNGNLSLLDATNTAVQPSELSAELAGLYNALLTDFFGNPLPPDEQNSVPQEWIYTVANEAYVNAPPGILKPGDPNYGNLNWNGVVQNVPYLQYTGTVQTDPQGSGTIYQYRPNAFATTAGGTPVDLAGNSSDIFLVTIPGQAPIGRSNGLYVNGDTVTSGEWATTRPAYFAVNPADATGIAISAPIGGQVFLTTNQGVNWFSIGAASIFGNSQGTALAFGGRIPSSPSANSFIYNGTAAGKIFVTLSGGGAASSWTDISNGIPAGSGPILKIIADPKSGTFDAYAITATGVYYKADASKPDAWVDITGNLFSISKPLFGQTTTQTILSAITALQVDWRFAQPILYVAGNSGVFQSTDQGTTWALYPSIVGGATVDGGGLPNVSITDLNLVTGSLNSSGVVNQSTGRNILIASTLGRGLFEIQLNANSVPPGLGTTGPFVSSATLVPPNTATGVASFTVNFGDNTNPVRVDPSTLNSSNLVIAAPNGNFLPYTVTDISSTVNGVSLQNTFSIVFTPTLSGTYQLLMNPGVLDTAGRKLNQNQNGVNGEIPADNYSKNFTITVVSAPTITSIANQQAVVNSLTGPINFTVGDAVTPAANLTVTATSSNTAVVSNGNITLGGSGANRTITFTPTSAGVTTITVTVANTAGRQTIITFTVSATTVPSLPFSDQFTQPDAPTLSQNWVVQSGTIATSSGSALVTSSVALATITNITQVNSAAQATVTLGTAGNGSATLVARYSSASNSMYLGGLQIQNGVLTATIIKQVNGTVTTLAQSASIPLSAQYTILFEVVNDSLKLFLNGSLILFTYDTSLSSTGLTGFRLTNGNRLDNYTDDNIVLNTTTFTVNPIVFANTSNTNGADGTQLDRNWRDRAGNINVVTNAAVGQVAGANLSTYNMPATPNVGVQTTVAFTAAGQSVGIVQRYNGIPGAADQNMYWGALQSTSNTQQQAVIFRNVNGTWTMLSATAVSGYGGTLQFEASGSELKLFVNGVRVLSVYDSTFATGLVGLRMGQGGSANTVSVYTTSTSGAPLPFTDNFTTSTQNQLATTWTEQAGSFAVNTTTQTVQAQSPGANDATVNGISAVNVAVSAVIKPPASTLTAVGVIARYSGAGDTNMYWGALNPITTSSGVFYSAQIWKNVNGVWTNLNANANPITPASVVGQTLLFEVFGSSLKLYLNNSLVSFAFDTSITAAGSVGIRTGNGGTLGSFNASADNVATPTLPFSDSFTSGLNARNELSANWQERSGFFSVATGNAVGGSAGQTNVAALNGVNAANVTISGNLDFTAAGQSSQLIGRYTGTNGIGDTNYYSASVNTMPNGDALVRILLNNAGTVTVLSSTTLTNYFTGGNFVGTTTTLQFVISGNSLSIFLNGSGTATLTATDSTLISGSVGIRTNQGAGVGNFSVTSP